MINPVAAHPPAASAIEAIKFILADSLTETPKRRRDSGVYRKGLEALNFLINLAPIRYLRITALTCLT